MNAGSVKALFRYPVKSMRGEPLTEVRIVSEHGVHGDRAFALLDLETGRVVSAKEPRLWGRLLDYEVRFVEPIAAGCRHTDVAITLPDGTSVRSDDVDVDTRLSDALGRRVRLSSSPPPQATFREHHPESGGDTVQPLAVGAGAGTFFDFAPLHLVTTATLHRLHDLRPESRFDVARFRPNVVVDTGAVHGFVENAWLGHVVEIGDEVRVHVIFPCPRCVVTTLAQGDLPADPEILRTAATHNRQLFALLAKNRPTVGTYAAVVRGGTIRVGDPVRLGEAAPARRIGAFVHAVARAIRRR